MNIVDHCFQFGENALSKKTLDVRKKYGQFFTHIEIARFMAVQLGDIADGSKILDPGIGLGILTCAVIERLIQKEVPKKIFFTGFETDHAFTQAAIANLQYATSEAKKAGIEVISEIFEEDFLIHGLSKYLVNDASVMKYDKIIANPPYFKLASGDMRLKPYKELFQGYPNIYSAFMSLATRALAENGVACFIVPRSFCSGTYFKKFRLEFIKLAQPQSVHLFDTRGGLFSNGDVLQENLIITFGKRKNDTDPESSQIKITSSNGISDLILPRSHDIPYRQFFDKKSKSFLYRLPISKRESSIIDILDGWPGTFSKYGFQISTGPVVPFRCRPLLLQSIEEEDSSVPLFWMENIKPFKIIWPVTNGKQKPQAIISKDVGLLVRNNQNRILVRRFSAKEDKKRLIASHLFPDDFSFELLGLENHINFIHCKPQPTQVNALGITALLNSKLMDQYMRIISGNTQINATDLYALPLPPITAINEIGAAMREFQRDEFETVAEQITTKILKKNNLIPKNF